MLRALVMVSMSCLCLGSLCPRWAAAQEPTAAEGQPIEQAPAEGETPTYDSTDGVTTDRSYGGHSSDITGQFYYRVRVPVTKYEERKFQVAYWVTDWHWDAQTCSNVLVRHKAYKIVTRRVPVSSFEIKVFCKSITLRASDVSAASECACDDSEFLNRREPGAVEPYRAAPSPSAPAAEPPTNGSTQNGHDHAVGRATPSRPQYSTAMNVGSSRTATGASVGQSMAATKHAVMPAYWMQSQPVVYLAPTVPYLTQ